MGDGDHGIRNGQRRMIFALEMDWTDSYFEDQTPVIKRLEIDAEIGEKVDVKR